MIRISSPAKAGRKDKRYYALTGKGLEAFIDENSSPFSSSESFWKAVVWYCFLNPKQTSFSDFEKYCSYFESKYLGHPAVNMVIFFNRNFSITWLRTG